MREFCSLITATLCFIGTSTQAQSNYPVYGNQAGCDVHFERQTVEAADMVLLKDGELMFYEIACKNLVVGNQSGRIETLSAQCLDYEGTYDFTWNFVSDGQDGFVFSTPDQSFSTVLKVCR